MTFGKVLESFKSRLQSGKEDQELYLIDKKSGKPVTNGTLLSERFAFGRGEVGGERGWMVGQFCSESKVEFPNGRGWGLRNSPQDLSSSQ